MAEVDHLIVVSFPKLSGLPEDTVQNHWVVFGDEAAYNFADASGEIQALYNNAVGTRRIAAYLSNFLNRDVDGCLIEDFDITGHLDGSPHGPAVDAATFQLQTAEAGQDDVPAECGVVVTLYGQGRLAASVELAGPPVSRPKSSRTGRVYLGPLNEYALANVSNERRVKAQFQDDIAASLEARITSLATLGLSLGVWSRKLEQVRAVTGGHVDNALDTQRRRGPAATSRVQFGVQL